jgi:hypothetical protein
LARNTLELTRYQNFGIQGNLMSVKNEASGRNSVQVEVEVPGSTQTAGERRSAEAQLRTLMCQQFTK